MRWMPSPPSTYTDGSADRARATCFGASASATPDPAAPIDRHTERAKAGRPGVDRLEVRAPALDPSVFPIGDEEARVRRERQHHRLGEGAEVVAAATDLPDELA